MKYMSLILRNKQAFYEYDIKAEYTAGLVLEGREVKAVKQGNVSFQGSYVGLEKGEAFLVNTHIGAYAHAPLLNYNPIRKRKLLLNKTEMNELFGKEKGLIIVPLELFSNPRGRIKLKIGLGRARKKQDKREYIKKREAEKEIRSL